MWKLNIKFTIAVVTIIVLIGLGVGGYFLYKRYDTEKMNGLIENLQLLKLTDDIRDISLEALKKTNIVLIEQNGIKSPTDPYQAQYQYVPYEYHSYFYPYRRYVRPYYGYYSSGRWYKHFGNYYYVW